MAQKILKTVIKPLLESIENESEENNSNLKCLKMPSKEDKLTNVLLESSHV